MKKLILLSILTLIFTRDFAQSKAAKKDTTVKEVIVLPVQKDRIFYLMATLPVWNKLVDILRKSKFPSDEVDDMILYIQNNSKEYIIKPDSTKLK